MLNLKGKRFGNWLVKERTENKIFSTYTWLCECDCGTTREVCGSSLVGGNSQSCGCAKVKQLIVRSTKHGLARHPLYNVWRSMIRRCHGKSGKNNRTYELKGIKVCPEWKESPVRFISWALMKGKWKSGLQLDREDNDGNYEPSNCRFVTPKENADNRDKPSSYSGFTGVTFHKTKRINQWAAKICDNRKTHYVGYFKTAEMAALARHALLIENYSWKRTDPAVNRLLRCEGNNYDGFDKNTNQG